MVALGGVILLAFAVSFAVRLGLELNRYQYLPDSVSLHMVPEKRNVAQLLATCHAAGWFEPSPD